MQAVEVEMTARLGKPEEAISLVGSTLPTASLLNPEMYANSAGIALI